MILIQGGGSTGTEGRSAHSRGLRALRDRRGSAAHRRQRRARCAAPAANLPPLAEITAGLAHDLNNRLSVILGHAQLLLRLGDTDTATARRVEKIEQETMRASLLTRGLLDLSRRHQPKHGAVSINRIVPQALAQVQAKLRGRRIAVQVDLTTHVPVVRGDAEQLTQLVVNLLTNAIDAMGETGTLTVTTAIKDEALELAVIDTGGGMDAEEVSRSFAPFYTTKPEGEGMGLGLFLALSVLKSHGGTITVDSAPGCGTTMRVRLPRPLVAVAVR